MPGCGGSELPAPGFPRSSPGRDGGSPSGRAPAEQCAVCAAAAGACHPAHGEETAAGSWPAWGTHTHRPPASGTAPPQNHSAPLLPQLQGAAKGQRGLWTPSLAQSKGARGSPVGATTTGRSHGREELVTASRRQMAGGALAQGQVPRPGRRGVCLGVWHPREWGDPGTSPCHFGLLPYWGAGLAPLPCRATCPTAVARWAVTGAVKVLPAAGPPCLWPCAGRHPGEHAAVTP